MRAGPAFWNHCCSASIGPWSGPGRQKSTVIVVPPASAAAVPLSKSSAEWVPMKGISMWVCGSMPPGMT